ncbi:MAG: peptidoglycan-binding protein [Beijerinckiaceae bacterium]
MGVMMSKAAPWSIKGVDFDAREAAREAARRSGVSLGDWLNSVIADRAAEQKLEPGELDAQARLDAVTARLQRLSEDDQQEERPGGLPLRDRRRSDSPMRQRRKQDEDAAAPEASSDEYTDEPRRERRSEDKNAAGAIREIAFERKRAIERDSEALLDQAIAAFERRANAAQRQTANALADVTEWMEESRSHSQRDREMLTTVADRVAQIEERVRTRPEDHSFSVIRDSIARLEERLEKIAPPPAAPPPAIETTLHGLDEKMNALAARIDRPRPAPAHPPAPPPIVQRSRMPDARALSEAVAEIAQRQHHLDGGTGSAPVIVSSGGLKGFDGRLEAITKRLEQAANQASGQGARESAALEALQKDVAGLAHRLEEMRRGGSPDALHAEALKAGEHRIESLREEIAAMAGTLADLAPRGAVESVESAIRELTLKLEASRSNGARDAELAPIEQLARELREALAAFDPRVVVERLEGEIHSIARQLETFQAAGAIDQQAFNRICEQTKEVRDLLTAAVSRPLPVEKIEEQISSLAQRLDTLPHALPRADGDIAASLDEIRSIMEQSEGPAFQALEHRLDALSDKFDEVAVKTQNAPQFEELSKRLDFLHEALAARIADRAPRNAGEDGAYFESMLHGLAEKLEVALSSRGDTGAHEALEQQIERLSQRLDKSDQGLASIASLDKSIGELFAQLEETRRAAIDAAEDAARAAAHETLRAAMPAGEGNAFPGDLSRELADLRSSQDAADQRLHATLTAVHDTLEKVVDRLALLEDDVADTRRPTEERLLASGSPPVFAPPSRRGAEPQIDPERPRMPPVEANRNAGKSGGQRTVSDDADFLIEPGSGFRPGRSAEDEAGDRNSKPLAGSAPSQANFIAAARRAVAAAQAADAEVQAQGEKRRSDIRPDDLKAGPIGRFAEARAALWSRKRPLLLGLAGLLLLLGAYQVLRTTGERAASPTNTTIETPAAGAKPPAKLGEPGPKAEISSPTQTMALAQPSQTAPSLTPPVPPPNGDAPSAASKLDTAPVSTIAPAPMMTGAIDGGAKDSLASLQSLAVTGDPSAQFQLGQRYSEGRTVARDPKIAAQWFEKAANQNLAPAQYRLGSMYEKGVGVARDIALSKMWYQRAAASGNTRAMHNLAVILAEGSDGKPDYASAASWFKQAAEYGVRDSQFNLAILYARGLGLSQNLIQSYVWFTVAAKQGDEDAGKKSQDVAARLDAKDLATAKSLAESFRPRVTNRVANEVAAPGSAWDSTKPAIGAGVKSVPPKISRL